MTTAEEKIREFLGHPCDVGSDCTEPECVIARGLLAALDTDDGPNIPIPSGAVKFIDKAVMIDAIHKAIFGGR